MTTISRREFVQGGMGASLGLLHSTVSRSQTRPQTSRPNIILIMADDMGYSDIGCYGSEIDTPNLNRLAVGGLRFTQFYNCARCCPTRASLMTGLYSHQVGVGLMTDKYDDGAYRGDLSDRAVTIAEALRAGGYHTLMTGKWHLTPPDAPSQKNWPLQRGFERFYGTILGAGSYFDPATLTQDNTPIRAQGENFFYTDAISKNASQYISEYAHKDDPFFLYVAFTSPHWPLQALAGEMTKYKDRYREGWDALRAERHKRMIAMGLVDRAWPLSPRDARVPPWMNASDSEWEMQRMAVYAAQIDRMDQGIGSIMAKVKEMGIEDNTLILFLSDNGGNYEELPPGMRADFIPEKTLDGRPVRAGNSPSIVPGGDDTYASYGIPWGNASNTPFRLFKHFAHEGGIATPLIAYWPAVIKQRNQLTHQVGHVIDMMATCLDVAGVSYPETYHGQQIIPLEGKSLLPIFRGREREGHEAIYWEHEGNSAVRQGKWKLVSRYPDYWELHNMEADRTELRDLSDEYPERVQTMAAMYDAWAKRVGVKPWPVPGATADPDVIPGYLRR